MLVKGIANLVFVLNSNKHPREVAAAIAMGLLLALIPVNNILWVAIFVISFFLKLNLAVEILFIIIFKLILPFTDPLLDRLGFFLLSIDKLQPFYTSIYNTPFIPFTRFNTTLVAGGLAAGIVLYIPVYFLAVTLVKLYRRRLKDKILGSKFVRRITENPFIQKITARLDVVGRFTGMG